MFRFERARITVGVVTVAAVAALIAGCSSSSSTPPASTSSAAAAGGSSSPAAAGGSGTRMAIFYYNPSPYGIASLKGAQQQAAKLGIQLDAFDANNNPQLD